MKKSKAEAEFADLVTSLASTDSGERDQAALRLRDLEDDRAVEPLFRAIGVPANVNHRGTLVWALGTLNCHEHFTDLFQLALHANFEVQCKALIILGGQEFTSDAAELARAKKVLREFREGPSEMEKKDLLVAELQGVLSQLESSLAGRSPG